MPTGGGHRLWSCGSRYRHVKSLDSTGSHRLCVCRLSILHSWVQETKANDVLSPGPWTSPNGIIIGCYNIVPYCYKMTGYNPSPSCCITIHCGPVADGAIGAVAVVVPPLPKVQDVIWRHKKLPPASRRIDHPSPPSGSETHGFRYQCRRNASSEIGAAVAPFPCTSFRAFVLYYTVYLCQYHGTRSSHLSTNKMTIYIAYNPINNKPIAIMVTSPQLCHHFDHGTHHEKT